jgi:hypothetical protein
MRLTERGVFLKTMPTVAPSPLLAFLLRFCPCRVGLVQGTLMPNHDNGEQW